MKIGVLGGGQLSRMLALSGIPMGLQFVFYFPEQQHALQGLGRRIQGAYDDFGLLEEFAKDVDVITYENENIPTATVDWLVSKKPVYPNSDALSVSQDRLNEKNFFCQLDVPTNRFRAIDSLDDVKSAAEQFGYPLILKKRTLGYDGKGQVKLNTDSDLSKISPCDYENAIAEEYVKFDREVSLIIVKSRDDISHYDICENTHSNGILRKTKNIKNDPILSQAYDYSSRIAQELNYTGVLTVEYFQVGDSLLANEMAPRVHNSGHWTIDACASSQFENHVRAIANLPLGSTKSITEAVMLNLLSQLPEKNKLLNIKGLCLHDYEKTPAKAGRKLGHVTLLENLTESFVSDLEALLF